MVKRKGPSGCDAGPLKANVQSAPYSALASQTQPEDQIPSVMAPKSGGRKSRDKGNRTERALVRILQYRGFGAERVPLRGSAGGSYAGDVSLPLLGIDRTIEVKVTRTMASANSIKWLRGPRRPCR